MNVLEHIEGLVSTKLQVFKTVISLIKLEARLAGLSIAPLILNICMLFVVFITVWLSTMFLVGYLTLIACNNLIISTLIVLFLNLGLLLGLYKYLGFNLKSMSFEKTRAYFSENESPHHDKLEKTSNESDFKNREDITKPTNSSDTA